MLGSLIILIELGLFSLLVLLAFRVLTLARTEPMIPAEADTSVRPAARQMASPVEGFHLNGLLSGVKSKTTPYPDKCALITQLHILASLQIRDCKQQGLDLETAHTAVREYAVCWMYGAACALKNPGKRNFDAIAVLVSQFVSRKMGIRQPDALAVISTLTDNSAALACFRGGIEGAEFWLEHHFVSREKSLHEAVTSSTFI